MLSVNVKLIALGAVIASVTGCASTRGEMEWIRVGTGGLELSQAEAKCDYETSAATQATDYSLRTVFGQELDRAMRKRDLQQKCLLANGFALIPKRSEAQNESAARYRALDVVLAQAKAARAQAHNAYLASPSPSGKAAVLRGNEQVRALETDLGYMKSRPIEFVD